MTFRKQQQIWLRKFPSGSLEKASMLFEKLSGVPMSDHLMHEVTNTVGDDSDSWMFWM